jgi:predicted RNase H-like nuclease (RuvC/YqgF family)|tara:strand:+ start:95 stop:313 length:219 start_codon:yes stop_codon:yes gene_type:complete
MNEIEIKNAIIKDLQEKIEMEKMVKQSEVKLNEDYKKHILNLETQIQALGKINDEFINKIAELKYKLQKLTT